MLDYHKKLYKVWLFLFVLSSALFGACLYNTISTSLLYLIPLFYSVIVVFFSVTNINSARKAIEKYEKGVW